MAVNIVRKPFEVDFIQNNLNFVFKGDNIQVAGTKPFRMLYFNTHPQPGATFTLIVNGITFNYTVISSTQANNSIYKLVNKNGRLDEADLLSKLRANLYISQDFTFEINYTGNLMRLIFGSKNPGKNIISIITDGSFNALFPTMQPGIPRTYRKDYKVWARFNFEYMKSGNKIAETSPEILLDVDNNGYATLPVDILKKIAKGIDAPASLTQSFGANILNNIMIKYSLEYSEMYDGEIKWVKRSDDFYAINGLNSTSGASTNLPDWEEDDYLFIRSTPYIRLFGCNNNMEYITHSNGKDYLYLCLFDSSKSGSYSRTLTGSVEIYDSGGFSISRSLPNIIIQNYSVVRVPAYLLALFDNTVGVFKYTLSLWDTSTPNRKIVRTYIIKTPPFYMLEFLLQNKYGVLEYFFANTKNIKNNVEGDNIVINNIISTDITKNNKIFDTRSGPKTYDQLKLIAQAAINEHNYIILKDKLIPISIIPESITILDETKDLQEASFKWQFRDGNTEEIVVLNLTIAGPTNPTDNKWNDYGQIGTQGQTIFFTWDDTLKINELNIENQWKNYNT